MTIKLIIILFIIICTLLSIVVVISNPERLNAGKVPMILVIWAVGIGFWGVSFVISNEFANLYRLYRKSKDHGANKLGIEYFDTEEWQAKEHEADEDIKAGNFDTVNTIDELTALFNAQEEEIRKKKSKSRERENI